MSRDVKVEDLSLEEKVQLLVGAPWRLRRIHGAAGETRPVRGLPMVAMADGPSGIRIEPNPFRRWPATAFPVPTMLASTWNPDLVEAVGEAMGEEARDYGISVFLAPGINIHRHPLCGRNFEYFSEDPLLAGKIASAYVRGVQSVGVAATPKHFAANEQETNRTTIDTIVDERALREIYLKPFEIVVKEAKPWAIMSSYNKLNGKYASQNEWLLTKVLREEWGFDGIVMSDWGAGDNPIEQVKAGNDLIMPGSDEAVSRLINAVKGGELSEDYVNRSAARVLEFIKKTLAYRGHNPSNSPNLKDHAKLAYEAAAEGLILLKNNDALPLNANTKIALFGTGQVETNRGGLGSGHTHPRYFINILDGLRGRGLRVDEELSSIYANYVKENRGEDYLCALYYEEAYSEPLPQDIISEEQVRRYAERNDVAIIVITRNSGEGWDRKPIKGDYYLTDGERRLIEMASRQFHSLGKKIIAILNIPAPIEVASWRDLVDAILLVWLPGQEAGRVIADALIGAINPSGKLPVTFPKDLSDVPALKSPECYPGIPKDNPGAVRYCEGIYVGYRYYDKYNVEPAYEFGYGLSYTKFEYRNLNVVKDGELIKVSFDVINVGKYPGKEAAQVYVKAPQGSIDKPVQELKAFRKTRLLNPGESEHVELTINVRDLASFNEGRGMWIVDAGEYEVRVGASSRDIRLTGKFTISSVIEFKP
ncbi:glycoside hydrolase family 3 N-terminal domain-containing protein [Caldivirga sp. UBA161]|uniref:glycoside hydrolase family 3 N-terminal domain-containing protein n=1 Tax=Caldivirga sp. UBA161 TaxID=1915569 RepID=UPI0025C5C246|nr:glycoside hydrolase family 3 N-terminal domain-containing protein [Caldivirga sp. UBA161]